VGVPWALEAQRLLVEEWGVAADVWSATSWTELRREALACDEWNLLHPGEAPRLPHVARALEGAPGPVVAVSDWMRAVPDQIRPWVSADWASLGTDGFGCSDTRFALRRYFHVDAQSIVLAVLSQLARLAEVKQETVADALRRYRLDDPGFYPSGVAATEMPDDGGPLSRAGSRRFSTIW
jgi:pyruvate dehydrogenase E1 component